MIAPDAREAWHAMGANRLRSFLTMLGMVIGVAAVILMLAVGQGAQYAVDQSIASMGSNLFIVLSGSTTSGGVRMGMGATPTLTTGDAEAIGELPSVAAVAPIVAGHGAGGLRLEQLEHDGGRARRRATSTVRDWARRVGLSVHGLGRALRHARRAARQDGRAEPVRRRGSGRQDHPHQAESRSS